MIRKLQIKFIATTMVVTFIIVSSVYSATIIGNFRTIDNQFDGLINLIIENDGKIPEYKENQPPSIYNKETRYSTRYFTILLNNSNEIVNTNLDFIASISQNQAEEIKDYLISKNRNSGYYGDYKYKIVNKGENKLIVMLNCAMQLRSFKTTAKETIITVAIEMLAVLLIVSLLSKKILRPIIESFEKQKQFITNASHELKTPLAVITADIDLLEMTVGEENEWVQSIKNQTENMNSLIKGLLNLSSIEEGKKKIQKEEFSLTNMIQEEIDNFKLISKGKEIKFSTFENILINADPILIKELISILIDNSIKYTPKGGIIEISASKRGKGAKFEIANTCDNAKEMNPSKLFDRFYREDKSHNKRREGYGIGLSIAKSIVDFHNGKISAEINKNNMICFRVIL